MTSLAFSQPPARLAAAAAPTPPRETHDAFFRDVNICPDGSCLLATADDRSLSLYPLADLPSSPSPSSSSTLEPYWTHRPSDSVLSTAWYPGASSADPSMFAFAAAVKDHPVHLLDGSGRTVRASYPIVDHVERFVAPHSMAFSPDGTSLYCGFENAIEVFDVASPGAEGFRIHTVPTRSSRDGQKGIISSLAFSSPDPASPGSHTLAAGSFSGSVGLYDPSSPTPLFDLLFPSQRGGVTQLLFHPLSPHLLFCASRQSTHLDVWDLRNTSKPSSHGKLRRPARTNQRMGFSIDPSGTWLAAGDQDGILSVFSAQPLPDQLEPVASYSLSDQPLGATLFHPTLPLLITCSGTRRFKHFEGGRRLPRPSGGDAVPDEGSGSSSSEEEAEDDGARGAERASLEVWQLS
ncbi:hypothetical protein JCM10207_008310 [Rhodosporidiobolus poonsookiae]